MPDEIITIGGKTFEVACQPGEEHFLQSAARLLDAEARVLLSQIGRLPEARMLLMSGLMLADKIAGLEDRVARAEEEAASARAEAERLALAPRGPAPAPAVPPAALASLAELAARAESLAEQIETRS